MAKTKVPYRHAVYRLGKQTSGHRWIFTAEATRRMQLMVENEDVSDRFGHLIMEMPNAHPATASTEEVFLAGKS